MTKKKIAIARRKTVGKSDTPIGDTLRHEFYESIADVLRTARGKAFRAVNTVMVEAYWNVGRMIVEEEQQGKERAGYGEALMRNLSERLTLDFGKGFNVSNLWAFRQFYLAFPILRTVCGESSETHISQRRKGDDVSVLSISTALRRELTWSHYRLLIRVEKPEARQWYMQEAAEQNWAVRALERQINSLYYERLLMSRNKKPVVKEMQDKTRALVATPQDFIKDPYVLEFLGLKDNPDFRESDLEQSIIGNAYVLAQQFLDALPFGTPPPSFGAEPDGHITMEWHHSVRRTLSVSVSPEGELHYAAILGSNKTYGTEVFYGEAPKKIVDLIFEVLPS